MKMSKQYGKPIRKCSIEELCTSWGVNKPRNRWCSDDEGIAYICKLIELEIIDLDDMKQLLFYNDYCKVRKAYNSKR